MMQPELLPLIFHAFQVMGGVYLIPYLVSSKLQNFDGNYRAEVDISSFTKGIYNLKITTDAGVAVRRITKL